MGRTTKRQKAREQYPLVFLFPVFIVFTIFFLIPVATSFYYSLTVWDFHSVRFVGLENYRMFFAEQGLRSSVGHTLLYAFMTSGLKVILAFFIAIFLTSRIKTKSFIRSAVFFPNLVSTMAVGMTFAALMYPRKGLINVVLQTLGGKSVDFLGNVDLALFSVIGVDVWKGLSISVVIYIAGIQSIDSNYFEAAAIDGASLWQKIRHITLPLTAPARNSIIILSLIGGLRCFDLIWAMTGGGPGFATDVLASVIYKQYAYGYYGLSTAGNVIMLLLISVIAFPLQKYLTKKEDELA